MCIYVFTIICIRVPIHFIYNYVRVPRIVARVCRTYVISGRVYPLAQSELCRILTCCLWKGEKKNARLPPRTTSGSINGDATKRETERVRRRFCYYEAVGIANCPAWTSRKKRNANQRAREARFLGELRTWP